MGFGFEFRERMTGTYHLLSAPADERPLSFTIGARVHSLARFAFSPIAEIQGEIDAQGFADHKALRGTLEINPIVERRLVYEFRFPGNDGQRHRFRGEKHVDPRRLADSMTTLPASVFLDEREVARALVRFDLAGDLVKFLRGLRLAK